MHEECIRRIKEAAGNLTLTENDLKTIEQNATRALQELSKKEGFREFHPSYKVKTASMRAKDLHLQGKLALAELVEHIAKAPPDKQLATLLNALRGEHWYSLEGAVAGTKGEVYKYLSDFHTLGSKYGGFANDPEVMAKVYKAIRGVETDDSSVNAFAHTIRKVYDRLTKQARVVGLEFNVLEHFSPQPHDRVKIGRISADDFVQTTKQRIDIKVYEQKGITGKDLDNFLKEVYYTLSSGGGNKVIESSGKTTSKIPSIGGSRHNPRQLHFTPEGYSEHMQQFGENVTPSTFISRSFNSLIRDIEVAKSFGANAHENFNWMLETVKENNRNFEREKLKGAAGKKWQSAHDTIEKKAKEVRNYWDRLTISRELPYEELSSIQKTMRKSQSLLFSFNIAGTFGMQIKDTLPELINTVIRGSPRLGITISDKIKALSRYATDSQYRSFVKSIAPSFEHALSGMLDEVQSGVNTSVWVLADKAIKWQGLKAIDTFHTRFVSTSLMAHMGDMTKGFKDLKDLKRKFGNNTYNTLVRDFRFTETDLRLLSRVEREGGCFITTEGIRNLEASIVDGFAKAEGKSVDLLKDTLASKFNSFIWGMTQEHARGSMHSTLQDTKWLSSRGGVPFLRFTTEFGNTPLSIMRQHLVTVPDLLEGGRYGVSANLYRAKFVALGMVLHGVASDAINRLIKGGKSPDYTDVNTYLDMFANAIPFYNGLFPKPSEIGNHPNTSVSPAKVASKVLGPSLQKVIENATKTGEWLASDEEKIDKLEKARDNFVKQLSKQVPLQNLWQIQLVQNVFQYNILDNIFDIFNPGYRERQEIKKEQKSLKHG